MSRHREQARFYVTGGDLRPDRDLPPPRDPVVDGITRLVDRRHVKELAIDSLPTAQRGQLERERRQLREHLAANPPPVRSLEEEERLRQRFEFRRDTAREQRENLIDQRDQTSWRERRTRTNLDERISEHAEHEHKAITRLDALAASDHVADGRDQAWLESHGAEAARLIAISGELHSRDTADRHAAHRVQAVD